MSKKTIKRLRWTAAALAVLLVVIGGVLADANRRPASSRAPFSPVLDPGTRLSARAPDFILTDQSGARVSLHSFRGKVVILAFNDSQCTTICPLTTTAMVGAKRLLGPAASRVALLGIDANPKAISVADVRAYTESHGMAHSWRFLTGSLTQLERVWRAYHIEVAVQNGQIDHTPALFVISRDGMLAKVYVTQMSYAGIPQQARLLAQEASSLLPGHPPVRSDLSYGQIPTIPPTSTVSLPRAGGGTIRLGPSGTPRLLAFFATWDSQVTDLARGLTSLGSYESAAASQGLPRLVAVDEGSVEPSPGALPSFLRRLSHPLGYPVAIDRSGQVADGYGVQDEPWFVLVSGRGHPLWYYDVSTAGWLSPSALRRDVRAALKHPSAPSSAAAIQAALAGSPSRLAALHRQAGQLLGSETDLLARLRALRGYPIVVNAWASWCAPCRNEFGLFASASAAYGRRVAFVGVDTSDSPGDARAFLAQHLVSYPSYQASSPSALSSLAVVVGLPTTIFIAPGGRVTYVHAGAYDSQGTLDQDISAHARGA
jgi:cytochrome oxidase Cu insertion factor (SCO1/SenC/PrrC family)/thiol-disulfide isomerase/thioredoxin